MNLRKLTVILILCLVFSAAKAQQKKGFTSDTALFVTDVNELFRDVDEASKEEARRAQSSIIYLWQTHLLSPEQRVLIHSTCLKMQDKKCKASPHYIEYFNAVSYLIKQNFPASDFLTLHSGIEYCFNQKSTSRILEDYLEKMNLFFRYRALMKSKIDGWYIRKGDFKLMIDTVPYILISNADLACVGRSDSSTIYNTFGRFYPLNELWLGEKGTMYWDRAGFDHETVYTTFTNYQINTRYVHYIADSVYFVNKKYFKQPVIGQIEERLVTDVDVQHIMYPRFRMYQNSNIILALFKGISYSGGFGFEGDRVVGFSNQDGLASIEIKYRDKDPFVVIKSKEFMIRPDKFVSARASVTFYFPDGDSLYHPGAMVKYINDNQELLVDRSGEGLAQSPFFNSYHKLDMMPEALYFNLNDSIITFEAIRGLRSNSEALFTSSDYFSLYEFDKLQGMDDQNPAFAVSAYSRRAGSKNFYAQDFANYLKQPIEQVRVMLIKLANKGLINYQFDNDFVKIMPRLNEYLAAKGGAKDYDIIKFSSKVEKGPNAKLFLKSMNLALYGVDKVMLSDTQFVFITPKDGNVTLRKNRDFIFMGRVHAGFFDFYARDAYFNYEKFLVDLPKIDSMSIFVPAWEPDANGYRPFVKVRNVLADMSGVLQINELNKKSGRKSLQQYPYFTSKDNSYLYFDSKSIVNGAYTRKNFYYTVYPFTIDSMNWLSAENVVFQGKLISGIFDDIDEPLRVQRDYSLGFRKVIGGNGIAAYNGKGVFRDTLKLDNSGLRGSGTLNYLTSTHKSKEFLFCPDSTRAVVNDFDLAAVSGNVDFPQASGSNAALRWLPAKDEMTVSNLGSEKFSIFNKQATLTGGMTITPKGLNGQGNIEFEDAKFTSKAYKFGTNSFNSLSADFTLIAPDKRDVLLNVNAFKTDVDLIARKGEFESAGKSARMEMPKNKMLCTVDAFDWMMDQRVVNLRNTAVVSAEVYANKSQDQLIDFNSGNLRFVSTDPKQDSLSFFATTSQYDMNKNVLDVADARVIKVADAAVFPKNGKVTINPDGKMNELKQAEIIANTKDRFYKFYNAAVAITSKFNYTAKGLYDYKPADGQVQTIEFKNISVDNNLITNAKTKISDSLKFRLNNYFGFRGTLSILASDPTIGVEGAFRILHDCDKLGKDWVETFCRIDPKKVMFPVGDIVENDGDGKLRVATTFSLSENIMKPTFFLKPDNVADPDILGAKGFLYYNPLNYCYTVTPEDKIGRTSASGNSLYLNNFNCTLSGEGLMNLASDLGRLEMTTSGTMVYNLISDSMSINIFNVLEFFFEEDALKIMANEINKFNLPGLDVSSRVYDRGLRELAGEGEADRVTGEQRMYGQWRRITPAMDHSIVFADLQMKWNPDQRAFYNQGPIGISNIRKTQINKKVNGYFEIMKRRSGDNFTFYLELDESHWYFFNYANGTMQALSTNKEFNDKLTGLSEKERVIQSDKGERSYQFLISTPDKKAVFLRKMKQLNEE